VTLDTLRLFCDVVRLRSFSRAAAASGVSQSAASQAIQQLEGEVHATLLDRTRRPLEPTAEGRGFYEACRGLLAGFEPISPLPGSGWRAPCGWRRSIRWASTT
jgi:DNA-binding transcriptional LysR family regulator